MFERIRNSSVIILVALIFSAAARHPAQGHARSHAAFHAQSSAQASHSGSQASHSGSQATQNRSQDHYRGSRPSSAYNYWGNNSSYYGNQPNYNQYYDGTSYTDQLINQQSGEGPKVYTYPLSSSVGQSQPSGRQHHMYWHPTYNFYNNQYHFYPYVNVASTVELNPGCRQIQYKDQAYCSDQWTFYKKNDGKNLAIPPPLGVVVPTISSHAIRYNQNAGAYYLYNGVYYQPVAQGYQVIAPRR